MANSKKMMELYIFRAKRLVIQYLAVKRVRRVIALIAVVLLCAVVYSHMRHQKRTVSAVGCKSKIAQVGTYRCYVFVSYDL